MKVERFKNDSDHAWNAFIREDIVLGPTGSGILQELTFAVKDVFSVQGHVNSAGNPDWLRTHHAAPVHAQVITTLLHHGAQLTGITYTDELMYGLNGENAHYGTPVNPKVPARIPGGSSSGSAVAVAAGLVDFALGTDTGGSVRIPAHCCGIYGFRPTHGMIPMDGVIPLAPSFDTVGWFAANPQLLDRVGHVLLPVQKTGDKSFQHLIIAEDVFELAEQACREVLYRSLTPLTQSLPYQERVTVAPEGLSKWMEIFRILQGLEIWQNHGEWINAVHPQLGPGVAERFAWCSTLIENEHQEEAILRDQIRQRLIEMLGEDGLMVIPTAPGPAPFLQTTGNELENWRSQVLKMTSIAGLAGLPQVSIPLMMNGQIPIGFSVIAGPNQDQCLLGWLADLQRQEGVSW